MSRHISMGLTDMDKTDIRGQISELSTRGRDIFACRIRRLADYLHALPRKDYEHEFYGTKSSCGTSACALGHAALSGMFKRAGLRFEWLEEMGSGEPSHTLRVFEAGNGGPRWDEESIASDHVFGPGVSEAVFHNMSIDTPKQAAAMLRRFADTFYGKEPWL